MSIIHFLSGMQLQVIVDFKRSPKWANFWPWSDYQSELAMRAWFACFCVCSFLFSRIQYHNGTGMAIISKSHFGIFGVLISALILLIQIWTLLFNLVWIFVSELQHQIGMVLETRVDNNTERMNCHTWAHLSFIQHTNLQNHTQSIGYFAKLMWHQN